MIFRITGLFILGMCCLQPYVNAQPIDNAVSFRNIQSDRYTRIYYENDFFTGTDRDYTQGACVEWVRPSFNHFPLMKLLWHPRNSSYKYGISLEDDGYTPNYIDRTNIQYGDRPYAGLLFIKSFLTAVNSERHEYISTEISVGVIGQAAGGKTIQTAIHHWINYTKPVGWPNQIRNDAILNYQVNYEKQLWSLPRHLSFAAYASARAGTLNTQLAVGFHVMAGNFISPFTVQKPARKKWQYYLYYEPTGHAVGYDATLQGGLFNRSSPYTIANRDINRLIFQNKFGLVLMVKGIYLEYFQTTNTPEFSTSVFHRTGGIQLSFGF